MEWNEFLVDVAGVSVIIKNEQARDQLQRVNSQFSHMVMALNRIRKLYPHGSVEEIAREALQELD